MEKKTTEKFISGEVYISLNLYRDGDGFGIWLSDDFGGSGIEATGNTPEEAANNIASYIADYFYEHDDEDEEEIDDEDEEEYDDEEEEEYYNGDFLDALQHYGELEHEVLMDITEDEPLIIDGKEVDTILDDAGLCFSYVGDDGEHYSSPLHIDDIDKEICDKIYEYLCDNRNVNQDFFDSLPR